jgi:hypothetical protein
MAITSKYFEEGMNAYKGGRRLIDNPYDPHSMCYDEWYCGYVYAELHA